MFLEQSCLFGLLKIIIKPYPLKSHFGFHTPILQRVFKPLFFKEVNIFDLNKVFYAGIAFLGLFAIFYLLVRLIGIFLHFMPLNHFDDFPYHIVSGFLAVSVALMFLSMITSILATVPIPTIQDQLSSHFILKALVDHCPPMTTLIRDLWIHKII